MSEYTKKSENIYFLNDKNITSSLIDDSVLSNAIPSHEIFKKTYDELSAYDNNLCIEVGGLNTKTNTINSNLCSEIENLSDNLSLDLSNEISSRIKAVQDLSTSLSNTADEKFVLKTGDTISKLSVGELKTTDTAIFEKNVEVKGNVVIGNAKAPYESMFVWNGTEDEYVGKGIDTGIGNTFSINPNHELCGMFIGDKSLCAYISEDVALTATDIRKEINAVSTLLTADYALCSDVSAVSKLTNDKGYLVSSDFKFNYNKDDKNIILDISGNILSIDASNFIKDGMLSTASIEPIVEGGKIKSYALVLKFNTYAEGELKISPVSVDLSNFIDVYTASEDGIELDGNTFKLDFGVVGKKFDVDQLSGQIKNLCNDVNETFEIIKDDIEDLSTSLSTNVIDLNNKIENNATFAGHLQITKNEYEKWWNEEATYHLSTFLEKTNSTIFRKLKNGDIYCIEIEGINENDPFILEKSYIDVIESDRTGKTIRLAHKDYIVIHKHNIEATEITYDNVHNYVEIIPSVRFYELYDLSVTVSSDYVWLSGGNNLDNKHAISGDNYFLGRNDIEDLSVKTLSADWNNVKHPTGYSLYELSADLTSEVIRAQAAESDNASAIKAISADYLKQSDKTELRNSINLKANSTELTSYIQKTVIADVLKDITGSSDLTTIANALTALYNAAIK